MEAICIYIVFTTGKHLCHDVLPRALAKGKKLTSRPTRGKNNICIWCQTSNSTNQS